MLIAPLRPVFHQLSCSNERSEMPKTLVLGPVVWIRCVRCEKFRCNFILRTYPLMAPVRPVFDWLSCSNETVRNAPKYEFWVQWSGSGAFVAKRSDATSFSELVRLWHMFGQFSNDFSAVTKRSETPQNMCFGSNGVDTVRLLWKIPT
jgi:hypothetical protein